MMSSSLRTPILCLSLLALAACSGKAQEPPKPPTPEVGVVVVQPQSAPLTRDLVGRLSAYLSSNVTARVSGVLLKRVYTEGSEVKKGQLMFQIDPAVYQAALNSSIASLASAKATYVNAHVTANRDRSLIPQGYVSHAQLDTDEAAERTAAAAVQQAQAAVASARINLGYTSVVSPIDGRSGQQQVTVGALVGTSTTDTGSSSTLLTTVDQIDPLYVNFTMSASDLEKMRRAATSGGVTLSDPSKSVVQVVMPDGSRYAQDGTLDFSDTTVDPTTGSVTLRAKIPNPQYTLLPGLYVTIKANLGEQHNIFLVPQAGVQRDTTGAYVLVVGADGNVARKNVSADQSAGSNWIVTSGLSAGDQVIVSGLQTVKEGSPAKAQPLQATQDANANQPAPAGSQAVATQGSKAPSDKQ